MDQLLKINLLKQWNSNTMKFNRMKVFTLNMHTDDVIFCSLKIRLIFGFNTLIHLNIYLKRNVYKNHTKKELLV